jgi:nucleoid-associated protein YgaU
MIRMILLAVAFVGVTAALLVFQPGSRHAELAPLPDPVVTRAEPALEADDLAVPGLLLQPALTQQPTPPVPVVVPQGDMDDQALRKMTWDTLSNLNHATGKDSAPGQPGSLLHTIVKRSLDEGAVAPAPAQVAAIPSVYIVQSGDSLVSIAEAIYGDVNMTGPLFAANQSILNRPDDLRPGQALVLPRR